MGDLLKSGIVVSPDRQFYYVSIAHGRPFGSVWKYSTRNDAFVGKSVLGYFRIDGHFTLLPLNMKNFSKRENPPERHWEVSSRNYL